MLRIHFQSLPKLTNSEMGMGPSVKDIKTENSHGAHPSHGKEGPPPAMSMPPSNMYPGGSPYQRQGPLNMAGMPSEELLRR